MKRSHITTGLLGVVLTAGLLVSPVAAATDSNGSTSNDSGDSTPTATASPTSPASPTPTSTPTASGKQDSPSVSPSDAPRDAGQNAPGATESPKATPEAPGNAPQATPSQAASSAPRVDGSESGQAPTASSAPIEGDEGMTADNTQYTDEASIISIHRNGCVLTFEVQVNTAGAYNIAVWDDGVQVGTVDVNGGAGEVVTATYTMGANVGTEAWGYDFVLNAGENPVQYVNWDFEGSAEVMTQCAAGGPEAPAEVTATAGAKASDPALAKTGPAAGLGVLAALSLTGAGVALRRARREA